MVDRGGIVVERHLAPVRRRGQGARRLAGTHGRDGALLVHAVKGEGLESGGRAAAAFHDLVVRRVVIRVAVDARRGRGGERRGRHAAAQPKPGRRAATPVCGQPVASKVEDAGAFWVDGTRVARCLERRVGRAVAVPARVAVPLLEKGPAVEDGRLLQATPRCGRRRRWSGRRWRRGRVLDQAVAHVKVHSRIVRALVGNVDQDDGRDVLEVAGVVRGVRAVEDKGKALALRAVVDALVCARLDVIVGVRDQIIGEVAAAIELSKALVVQEVDLDLAVLPVAGQARRRAQAVGAAVQEAAMAVRHAQPEGHVELFAPLPGDGDRRVVARLVPPAPPPPVLAILLVVGVVGAPVDRKPVGVRRNKAGRERRLGEVDVALLEGHDVHVGLVEHVGVSKRVALGVARKVQLVPDRGGALQHATRRRLGNVPRRLAAAVQSAHVVGRVALAGVRLHELCAAHRVVGHLGDLAPGPVGVLLARRVLELRVRQRVPVARGVAHLSIARIVDARGNTTRVDFELKGRRRGWRRRRGRIDPAGRLAIVNVQVRLPRVGVGGLASRRVRARRNLFEVARVHAIGAHRLLPQEAIALDALVLAADARALLDVANEAPVAVCARRNGALHGLDIGVAVALDADLARKGQHKDLERVVPPRRLVGVAMAGVEEQVKPLLVVLASLLVDVHDRVVSRPARLVLRGLPPVVAAAGGPLEFALPAGRLLDVVVGDLETVVVARHLWRVAVDVVEEARGLAREGHAVPQHCGLRQGPACLRAYNLPPPVASAVLRTVGVPVCQAPLPPRVRERRTRVRDVRLGDARAAVLVVVEVGLVALIVELVLKVGDGRLQVRARYGVPVATRGAAVGAVGVVGAQGAHVGGAAFAAVLTDAIVGLEHVLVVAVGAADRADADKRKGRRRRKGRRWRVGWRWRRRGRRLWRRRIGRRRRHWRRHAKLVRGEAERAQVVLRAQVVHDPRRLEAVRLTERELVVAGVHFGAGADHLRVVARVQVVGLAALAIGVERLQVAAVRRAGKRVRLARRDERRAHVAARPLRKEDAHGRELGHAD